jgi:hypothetical protein
MILNRQILFFSKPRKIMHLQIEPAMNLKKNRFLLPVALFNAFFKGCVNAEAY